MIYSHQISRLVFELSFSSEEKATAGQNKIADIVNNQLTTALEKILDKYDEQYVLTKIDKLEIDLHFIDLSASETEIARRIELQIELQLNQLLKGPNDHHTYTKQIGDQQVSVERLTNEYKQTEIDLVLFIIKNGHLPWWAENSSAPLKLNEQITNLIAADEARFFQSLVKELQYANFRKRFIQLFTGKHLELLIRFIHKEVEIRRQVFETIQSLAPSRRYEIYDKLIVVALMNNLQTANRKTNQGKYLKELVKIADLLNVSINELISIEKNTADSGDLTSERAKANASVDELTSTDKKTRDTGDLATETPGMNVSINENAADTGDLTPEKIRMILAEEEKSGKQSNDSYQKEMISSFNQINEDVVDGMIIQRAGLVLVIPFLSSFFNSLGLFRDKQFVSEKARHQAVYLLYYLAAESEDVPDEHHLVFEKICCGIDVADCLLPFQGFSLQEKEESNALLLSVLENWKALKNSSPEAIREAFLNRKGYLKKQEDGTWNVHIERQTIDVLIDRLPWTISIMRIPSVNDMLYVEW